jgi:N-acetylglucosamine-6-phosphate deacetylase
MATVAFSGEKDHPPREGRNTMSITLQGARLVDAHGERAHSSITIDGPRIIDVAVAEQASQVIRAHEMIITPGFIDVHTHGGGGFSLHTVDPQEVRSYTRWTPSTGTTAFLAAVVGVPNALPEAQLQAVVDAMDGEMSGAELLGVHLEGPYMNVARRGAHDPSWLRLPNDAETDRILELAGKTLRLITVAPELPGADTMIRRLVNAGVTVSIGHTDATYEQACAAIELGATHMTHCCNAMRPLHQREPGPLGAVVVSPTVHGEIIADGVHVHPAVVRLLVRAMGPERTVIVTDALAGAGVPDATFTFGGNEARVIDGVARLADGTITGSVLTMDQALRNVMRFADVPLHAAVGMLTLNPARSAGVAERKGLLQPGYDADLLIFDGELNLQATLCRGQLAWVTAQWRARFEFLQ